MSIVCSGGGGKLSYVAASNPAPLTVALSGNGLESIYLGILIGMQVSQKVAAQFQNAMNKSIYITPFGDLPGDVGLTFLLNGPCADPLGPPTQNPQLLTAYISKRLQPRLSSSSNPSDSTKILTLSIANSTFGSGALNLKGYIVGLQLNAVTQDTPMFQGTLLMKAWPA